MTGSTNASLSSLLSKSTLDDHEHLLRTSEGALKTSKTDLQAQDTKIAALLKLDRFQDAIDFFDAGGDTLKKRATFEYAYTLYKLGRLAEAIEVAQKTSGRGAKHVEAQSRYRMEDFEQTLRVYDTIQQETKNSETFDIRVNLGAISAQGQWLGLVESSKIPKPGREDLEAFETTFNAACSSLARGEFAQAEILLKRAKDLCKHSDDLTTEQKDEEMLPIIVQQLYVLHRLGKTTEAESIAHELDLEAIEDPSIRAAATDNKLVGTISNSNPFLLHKTFENIPPIPEKDKLFTYQLLPHLSNKSTIALNSFKLNALTGFHQTDRIDGGDPRRIVLATFRAAAQAGHGTGKTAINRILPEFDRQPTDVGLALTLVQLYTQTGNLTSAIQLLEALFKRLEQSEEHKEHNVRYHPGLVSVLTSLYRAQGRTSHVKEELAKAASYWRQSSKPPASLLRAAGLCLLKSSASEDISNASEIFKWLYSTQYKDRATIAGFVASNAENDAGTVHSLASQLTSVSDLTKDVNVDDIEQRGVPQSSNALAIAQGPSRKRKATGRGETQTTKRIRRSRLPKNHDEQNPGKPDPERWLPMRDRSYYRAPKGKKKSRKGDDRTQGGNVNEDLDINKRDTKAGDIVGANSGGSGGGGAKNKKKGKGKK